VNPDRVETYRIEYEDGPQALPMFCDDTSALFDAGCMGVKDGHSARPVDRDDSGTVGWCFLLNGVPVGLSNWHVFCGTRTCAKRETVLLGRERAVLFHVVAPDPGRPNSFDFALAKLPNVDLICGMLRDDQGTPQFDVPLELAQNVVAGQERNFRMTGNESISRVDQRLTAIADVDYTLHGRRFRFNDQLVFEAGMARRGDSGAVAVRQSDNTVAGLLFALDHSGEVYANPICQLLDWRPVGLRPTQFGRFPEFEGTLP
jgi:hypothetical protein